MTISTAPRQRKQFEAEITYPAAVAVLDMILTYALKLTIAHLYEWIDEKVPKRTGQLRDSLKINLKTSTVKNKLLKLYFGTHLDYAGFVNDMTTSQVAHDGEVGYAYYYGHYGKIILDDPNAIGGFFDAMIEEARLTLQLMIPYAIRVYAHLPIMRG